MESALHFPFQRRRQEVKIKRQSHLACRCQEVRGRVDVPSFPAEAGRYTAWGGVCRPSLVVDSTYLGPTGIPLEYARSLQFTFASILVVMEGRRSLRNTHARGSELRCYS